MPPVGEALMIVWGLFDCHEGAYSRALRDTHTVVSIGLGGGRGGDV